MRDFGLERGDFRAQNFRVEQGQIPYVFLISRPIFEKLFPAGDRRVVFRLRGRIGRGIFQHFELSGKLVALQAEACKLCIEIVEHGLLFGREAGEVFQLLQRLLNLRKLRCKLFALLTHRIQGGGELRLSGFQLLKTCVNLPEDRGFLARQFALSGGKLLLRVVKFCFHIREFFIDLAQNCAVEDVNSILIHGDGNLLFHCARNADRSHAVHRFQFRNERVLDIAGEFIDIHVLLGNRGNRDGQHIGIDFHDDRRSDRIVPIAGNLIDPRGEFDQSRIHIGAGVEFQNNKGKIGTGSGIDIFYAAERGEFRLHGTRDRVFHLFRSRAHIGGIYHDIGHIHIRQKVG